MMGKHIFVSGRVQGVGYRYFAKAVAQALNLTGWVRNLTSGEVEIQVFGEEDHIIDYLEQLKIGPPNGRVEDLDVREVEIVDGSIQNEFEIRPNGSKK